MNFFLINLKEMNSMTTDGYINCLTDNTNNKLLTEVIGCESDNERGEVIENNHRK